MEHLSYPEYTGQPLASALEPLTSALNEKDLHVLAHKFSEQYKVLAKKSTEHFLATPVTILPTGKERGKFLSIDVGGTNMRVGFVELLGEDENGEVVGGNDKIRRSHEKTWPIEEHLKMDKAEDLFAWIGDCIAEVIVAAREEQERGESNGVAFEEEINLGVTFSFPMTQNSMSEATLMPMGKGFAITSDLNLGKMLLAGYARHCSGPVLNGSAVPPASPTSPPPKRRKTAKLPRLRIAAITNDTVATYAALAYLTKSTSNSRVAMGLILGTGTNATIPKPLKSLHPSKREGLQLPPGSDPEETKIVVNTEWTIRGTDVPMRELNIPTKWDKELDKNCEAPGFQPFEYMTAGRYLGEIVRLCFLDLVSADSGPTGIPMKLMEKNSISTGFTATVIASDDFDQMYKRLTEMFPNPSPDSEFKFTTEKCKMLQSIARAVQVRSSALIAAAIVGLLACVGELRLDDPSGSTHSRDITQYEASPLDAENVTEELVVAYTGSLIQLYPNLLVDCQGWIDHLVRRGAATNGGKRVVLKEARDGGVIGAAVLAGMVSGSEIPAR